MATLREVRGRIVGVKKTQKITRAMKMVAAAKLRRAQMNVVAARPYAGSIRATLGNLGEHLEGLALPLLTQREVRTLALAVVTADRGLCGAFNTTIIKTAQAHLESSYPGWLADHRVKLVCIGKKGTDFFAKRQYPVGWRYPGVFHSLEFASAQAIVRDLIASYEKGEIDRVEIIYNEFKSAARQRVAREQLLPVPVARQTEPARRHHGVYLYEPSQREILAAMVPRHLSAQMWRILLESNAAEQGARMTAMGNATENANEMITYLQLQYNKARQASITKELLEVVTGAEALTNV